MTDPTWLEILVRIIAGEEAEQPTEGLVAVRLDQRSEELSRFRVWKHGPRWRVEHLSGQLRSIQGDRYTYTFEDEDGEFEQPRRTERARGDHPHDEVSLVLRRREPWDWRPDGSDYDRPAARPERTTFLGRDAWEVRLAPPRHKNGELVEVVDALDGRLLAQNNTVHGDFARWEELRVVESLPDDLFVWDGPFSAVHAFGEDDVPDELREEVKVQRRAEEALVASLGLGDLWVEGSGDTFGHVDDDGGRALVHWSASAGFHLLRHPLGSPVDEEDEGVEQTVWTDDRWRWTLATSGVEPRARRRLVEDLQERTRSLSATPDP